MNRVRRERKSMKNVKLFLLDNCPYCIKALRYIEELTEEYPDLKAVNIHMIEERKEKELADSYDYYLVPSFYVDEVKVHEGAVSKEQVLEILTSVSKA